MHLRDYVTSWYPTFAHLRVYQYFSTICFIIILIENNSLIDDVKAKPWNLAILGLFSIAIDLHLSLAGPAGSRKFDFRWTNTQGLKITEEKVLLL